MRRISSVFVVFDACDLIGMLVDCRRVQAGLHHLARRGLLLVVVVVIAVVVVVVVVVVVGVVGIVGAHVMARQKSDEM